MMPVFRSFKFVIIVSLILLVSCSDPHNIQEIEAALNNYDRLIQKTDADSLALLYTEDGQLSNIAHGRDSIRKFFFTLKDVKVLSQSSFTESIQIDGNSAIQKGTYFQEAVAPPADTLKMRGQFMVNWEWVKEHGWLIKQMDTKPVD
jgi:ketosteroid isomerase-like protein